MNDEEEATTSKDSLRIPDHITVNEAGRSADCSVCHIGVDVLSSKFGPVSWAELLASFAVQHVTHTKGGKPSGLTPGGRVSKAALSALGVAS